MTIREHHPRSFQIGPRRTRGAQTIIGRYRRRILRAPGYAVDGVAVNRVRQPALNSRTLTFGDKSMLFQHRSLRLLPAFAIVLAACSQDSPVQVADHSQHASLELSALSAQATAPALA